MSESSWRRRVFDLMVRGLTGFPFAVGEILSTPCGLAGRVAGIRGRLAGTRPRGPWRVLAPSFVAFGLSILVVFLIWSSYLYPLRPDARGALGHPFTADRLFDHAWGGPTLVGAWFVHTMAAL